MICPICKKELNPAIKVVGPDGYLFHMSMHIKDLVTLSFELLETISRSGKCNQSIILRARRILKERQAIRNAMKNSNEK